MNKTNRANSFIFENKSGTHTPISEMSGQPLHEASSRLNLFGKNEVIPLKNKALMQKKGKEKKRIMRNSVRESPETTVFVL